MYVLTSVETISMYVPTYLLLSGGLAGGGVGAHEHRLVGGYPPHGGAVREDRYAYCKEKSIFRLNKVTGSCCFIFL